MNINYDDNKLFRESREFTEWMDLRPSTWLPKYCLKYGKLVETCNRRQLWVIHIDRPGADVTVVFVHGMGGRAEQWEGVLDELHRDNKKYNIIVPNLLGHGRSVKPLNYEEYQTSRMVEDVHSIVEKLRVGTKLYVVGHSFGSVVAMSMANIADKVVLLGSAHGRPPSNPLLHCCECFLECIRPCISRIFASALFHESYDRQLFARERLVTNQNPWSTILGLGKGLEWPTFTDVDGSNILIMHGEYDGVFCVDEAKKLHKAMPLSKLIVLSDCAHNLMMERPTQVTHAILQFFEA